MKFRTAKKILSMDRRGAYVSEARFWKAAWVFGRWHARREKRPYGSRPIRMLAAQRKIFESMVFDETVPCGSYEGLFSKSSLAGLRHRSITAPMMSTKNLFTKELLDKIKPLTIPMRPMVAVMLPKHLEALKAKCGPVDPQTRMPTLFGGLAGCEIRTKDTAEECRALAVELQFSGHQVFLITDVDESRRPSLQSLEDELRNFPAQPDDSLSLKWPQIEEADTKMPSVRDYIDRLDSQIMRSLGVPASILNGGSFGSYSAYHSQFSKPLPPEPEE